MSHCLKTGYAMMRLTMLAVTLMVESAALTSTWINVLIALAIIRTIVLLDIFPLLLEMVSVMTRSIMPNVTLMVEIVVDRAF